MAIVKVLKVISTGTTMDINLGFIPSRLDIVDLTTFENDVTDEIASAQWYAGMPNDSALITACATFATTPAVEPVMLVNYATTGGVTPFQSSDSTLWKETVRFISAISKAAQAQVTSTAHGFTAADVGVTTVTFSGVLGMSQINTLRGVIQSIVSADAFTVNINSSSFGTYVSGGQVNVITGIPPFTQQGYQIFNTPQKNNGFIGVILGDNVTGVAGDILFITAFLDADFTS